MLFLGQLISTLGSALTTVAIPYQVYEMTHSSFQVGAVSLAQLIPLIFGALWGGAVGDTVNRRTLLLYGTIPLSAMSALLALNAAFSHPSLLALYLISSVSAGLTGFTGTARSAVIPSIVPANQLVSAYSFNQTIFQLGIVVGPAISGVLIDTIHLTAIYAIDATTFLLSVFCIIALTSLPPDGKAQRKGIGSILEGLNYLRGRQALQGVYLIDINAMIFGMPRALFPAIATTVFHGGAKDLGYLYAAVGVGGLIGASTTGWVNHFRRQGWVIGWAVVAWGAAIVLFGISHVFLLSLALLALAGWADVISAVLRNTVLQSSIPESFRSRMSSIQIAVVTGGPRLGDLESGSVASAFGTDASVISGGLACIVGVFVLMGLLKGFRNYLATEPQAKEVDS
jgi:MFS family permease